MTIQLQVEICYNAWDSESGKMEERRKKNIETTCDDHTNALNTFIEVIWFMVDSIDFPVIRLLVEGAKSVQMDGEFLESLELDYLACSLCFRLQNQSVKANWPKLYRALECRCHMRLSLLNLKCMRLDVVGERQLVRVIESQKHLETLVVTPVLMDDGKLWLDELRSSRSVRVLSLAWWAPDGSREASLHVQEFGNRLETLKRIRYVLLAPLTPLREEAYDALSQGLRRNSSIREVMLSAHIYHTDHGDKISDIASCISPRVRALHLPRLYLVESIDSNEAFNKLLRTLKESTSVETLDFTGSFISETNFDQIFENVLAMQKLKSLNLTNVHTHLGASAPSPKALDSLCRELAKNDRIKHLKILLEDGNDHKQDINFYLQRNRSKDLLRNSHLADWPLILAEVDRKRWNSLFYYLLRERVDLLLSDHSIPKRSRESPGDLPRKNAKVDRLEE